MKYQVSILLLFLLFSCSVNNKTVQQTPIPFKNTSGVITYQVSIDANAKAMGLEEVLGKTVVVTFNDSLLRSEKITNLPGQEFTITNLKTLEEITYLEMGAKKYAITTPTPIFFTEKNITYHENQTKEIAGYTCSKASIDLDEETSLDVYYTRSIDVNYHPKGHLNGFALAYSIQIGNGIITYTASEVQVQKIDEQKLHPASDFKKVNMREFQMEMMNNLPQMPIGEAATLFERKDMNQKFINLEKLRGKIVVINFWFTACKPCEIEMPDLNELKKSYQNQDIEFLAITFDSAEDVQDFLDQKQAFDFSIIPDARDLVDAYQIFAFPTTVILDKKGNIADTKVGGSVNIKEELQIMIEAAKKIKVN